MSIITNLLIFVLGAIVGVAIKPATKPSRDARGRFIRKPYKGRLV